MSLKANDPRIPLDGKYPQAGSDVKKADSEIRRRMDAAAAEGKKKLKEAKKRWRRQIRSAGSDKDLKKQLKCARGAELAQILHDSLKKQADIYAVSNMKKLPTDLTTAELKRIVNRAKLPQVTRGEERFSSITHIVGGGIALAVLIAGIVLAASMPSPGIGSSRAAAIVGMTVFGLGAVILYTISAVYHFLYVNLAKRVMRVLDHSVIYVLIASSYTPFCLLGALNDAYGANGNLWGFVLLGIEWALGIALIVCNCLWLKSKTVLIFSTLGYIVLGWAALAFLPALWANLGLAGFVMLLLGGVMYTVGAVMYAVGPKVRYLHGVAHIMYIFGTLLHFFALVFGLLV